MKKIMFNISGYFFTVASFTYFAAIKCYCILILPAVPDSLRNLELYIIRCELFK